MNEVDSLTYVVQNGKLYIKKWYKGKEELVPSELSPYCFIPSRYENAVRNLNYRNTDLKTIDTNEKVLRCEFSIPENVKAFRTRMENRGILLYEADIKYVFRYMLDNDIRCSNYTNRVYIDTEEDDSHGMPNPNEGNVPIISIAITQNGKTEVLDNSDEKQLLIDFFEILDNKKADLICGWNMAFWDFPFISKRVKYHQLKDVNILKYRWLDLALVYRYAEKSFKSRWSLEHVASRILNEQKPFLFQKVALLSKEKRIERVKWDTEAIYKIDKQKSYSDFSVFLAQQSHLFPDTIFGINQSNNVVTLTPFLDSLFLEQARKTGMVLPCKTVKAGIPFKGAIIYLKSPGKYKNVAQFDFSSLYPNILLGFHIVPQGWREIVEPVVGYLLKMKKDAPNEVQRWAYKISVNAIYGLFGSKRYRFPNINVAEQITAYARNILTRTKEKLEELGYSVIYEDTDSFFIELPSVESVKVLETLINRIVETEFNVTNIKVKFEKWWEALVFLRGMTGEGVKKKYFGIVNKNGQKQFEWVGLEIVRGDWCELSKEIQEEIIKMQLLNEPREKILSYLKNIYSDLKEGKLNSKLVLEKTLTKPLEEYGGTTRDKHGTIRKVAIPRHVRALLDAQKEGFVPKEILETHIVRYYMTKGEKPKLVGLTQPKEIDFDWYWNVQIMPVLYRMGIVDDVRSFNSVFQEKLL